MGIDGDSSHDGSTAVKVLSLPIYASDHRWPCITKLRNLLHEAGNGFDEDQSCSSERFVSFLSPNLAFSFTQQRQ